MNDLHTHASKESGPSSVPSGPDISDRRKAVQSYVWSIPNLMTYGRIVLVPVVMYFAQSARSGAAAWALGFFILASVTDAIDGYLARRWNQVSWLGQLLDPLADKLLVTGTLMMLIQLGRISAWLVFMLVAREMLVNGLRSVAAGAGVIVPAGSLGKYKTVFQMIGVAALLVYPEPYSAFQFQQLGFICLVISLGFSYISGITYFVGVQKALKLATDPTRKC